ncbi:MAG: ABC transporter substrate-binding protein [Actinomycetia bacterium]|nr:ABC transporter substrate-binding protein [Actinomycetes bacterium]
MKNACALLWTLLGVLGLVVTGCSPATPAPAPVLPSSITPTPREFTVAMTERPTTFDPVAVTDTIGAVMVQSLFQRLLSLDPGRTALKPDAAQECRFTSQLVYECTLREGLRFSNADSLTSSDVQFSITRALRLGVAGSSARQLQALDHIETPDPLTVRFHLAWPDSQFGYALASPAASIVDESVYDPDALRTPAQVTVGSGPLWLGTSTAEQMVLRRHGAYRGITPAAQEVMVVKYFPDSTSIEEAMRTASVDVVWRGLNAAALRRFDDQIRASGSQTTDAGYRRETLPGSRVHRLSWSTSSGYRLDAGLRNAVSAAMQEDRTLDSIIPHGVEGSVATYSLGGIPTIAPRTGDRPRLTLSYQSTVVGEREIARDIRDRIEQTAVTSVQLTPDTPTADLILHNDKAWTATPFAWLQLYRDTPLPGSQEKVNGLEVLARTTTDPAQREAALTELQKQAAADAVVLPIQQADDDLFLLGGTQLRDPRYGPGWQLGLWALGKA